MSQEVTSRNKFDGPPLGNQNASKKNRYVSDALRRKLVQDPDRADRIAEKILVQAEAGDLGHLRELLDRMEGKAVQSHTVAGNEDGNPIQHNHEVTFIGAAAATPKA